MKYLLPILVILFFSCKEMGTKANQAGKTKGNVSVLPVAEQLIISNQANASDSLVQAYRASAASILEHRISAATSKTATGMDKDLWVVDAVLKGEKMTFGDDVKGFWMDMGEDNTYKYGSYEVQMGSGKYFFDVDKSTLLTIDNDTRIKPQEFQTILTNDALVLVGSAVYGDNNMQAKFQRKDAMPVKPAKKPLVE
jgi:hypothetical protein